MFGSQVTWTYAFISWENQTLKPNHKYANLNSFMDMLDEHHMCQTIKEPTRGENTLDLFLTNNESLVNNCQVTPGISDHSAVLVESRVRTNMGKQKPRQIPMWNKMKPEDSEAFRKYVKEGWESISDETKQGSADTLWNWLTSRLEEGIKNMYLTELLAKKDRRPWISRKFKQMLKQEKKLHSKVKSYQSRNNISKLKDLQHRIQKRFRQEYWACIENIIWSTQATQNTETKINISGPT